MKKFEEYLNESVHINEEDVTEKSPLQKEFASFFKEILKMGLTYINWNDIMQ